MLVNVGWVKRGRVYGVMAHIDIIDGKVWIQTDGTREGLATELVEAGIPAAQIVLDFRMPEIRKHLGFATA